QDRADAERARRNVGVEEELARAEAERARRNVGVEEELARAEAERDAASQRAYEAERRAEGARTWARVAEREAREAEERAATAENWARAAAQAARARTDHHDSPPDGGDDIVDAEIVEDTPQIEAGQGGRQAADTTTIEEDAMSNDTTEAIGLDGALAWAQGAVATSTANTAAAEQVAAAMENGKVGSGPVGRAQQLMDSFAASQAIAQALVADLER